MTLQEATDAFVSGWTTTRRLSGPFEVVDLGSSRWAHDPSGRRMGELVGCDQPPEVLVGHYPTGERGTISAIYSDEESLDSTKKTFRALGWRLLRTEPMFFHRLEDLPDLDPRAVRTSLPEHVARVAKAAKMRPERMGADDIDDAPIRLYEASIGGQSAGWVRSVKVGPDAWVSALNVRKAYRRQGLGRALMSALLHDDARLGRRYSVLLASHTGALLYPKLGYERIGTLMLLMPMKSKAD